MTARARDEALLRRNDHDSSAYLLDESWRLYHKAIANNFVFHREAYALLHEVLAEQMKRPFRFLDIGCGDAYCSAAALADTKVRQYRGIDISPVALRLARRALASLSCEVILEEADLREALTGRFNLADVVWMGLSLHHLRGPRKLAYLRQIRRALAEGGLLVAYEHTRREGERRASWLQRWDLQRPFWTTYSAEEWRTMSAHVHAADFPESASTWRRFGEEAGFARVHRLYTSPTELFGFYCFET
jgi:SAM-dependent methyltransferase